MLIGTDCKGSCKSNYHTIATMTAPTHPSESVVILYYISIQQEEKAELKSQNYLLEKEKRSLELRLSGKESQEHAHIIQIEHLKSEVKDLEQRLSERWRNQVHLESLPH